MDEKKLKDIFSLFIKFGSKENLVKLQAGQLYMKNLKYYVDLERDSSDKDVGDLYDGQIFRQDVKVTLYDNETREKIIDFPADKMIVDMGFLKCPIYCLFQLDCRNFVDASSNGERFMARYEFTGKQRECLPKLGEYALVINNKEELINQIERGFAKENIEFSRDNVSYCRINDIEQIRDAKRENERIVFWKRKEYGYQQEYRFIGHTQIEDHITVDIGDISAISKLVKTQDLLNTYLEVSPRNAISN